MANKNFSALTTSWVAITSLITPEDGKTYYIQNRGPYMVKAQESASTPTDDAGICIPAYKVLKYVKGTETLYLKSDGISEINISDED